MYPDYRLRKGRDDKVWMQAVLRSEGKGPFSYQPLVETPALFLEFAGLADEEITEEVWLDWTLRYGVLGLEQDDLVRDAARRCHQLGLGLADLLAELDELPRDRWGSAVSEGGTRETHRAFVREVREARDALRLYEMSTAPSDPDTSAVVKRASSLIGIDCSAGTPEEARQLALGVVGYTVQTKIAEDCYPALYQEEDRVLQGWGFHTLLGAMWLQMTWLMTAGEQTRRCKGPGCDRIISYEQPEIPLEDLGRKGYRKPYKTRSDKVFCGDRCKHNHYYHSRRKHKIPDERGRTSPPS